MARHYDFANILFSGPCNQRCLYCIGRQLDPALNHPNLDEFPPRGMGSLISLIHKHQIKQITFTGTNTDPQLYQYEEELLNWLRARTPDMQISLHTNGQLALEKVDVFNRYDRGTISMPSFNPDTFQRMTGVRHMPDLAEIVRAARIPLKVSCVLTDQNVGESETFLACCREIGIQRVVFRECYGYPVPWEPLSTLIPTGSYRNNPVYDYAGMEVTYWRFEQTSTTCLNLFSDGSIGSEYLLARHAIFSPTPHSL